MYLGRYYHSLEDKGRVSLPKKFRENTTQRFVITRGLDGGLFLYPSDHWEKIVTQLSIRTFTKKKNRDLIRLITNDAQEVELDRLGRILIPDYLRKFARLQKDVVVIGSLHHIEIWDTKSYHEYIENIEMNAESIAEEVGETQET